MNAQAWWLAGQNPSAALAVVWQAGVGGGGLVMMLPLVLIFGVFYFLLILPQQKQKKKWQEMLGGLKNGDRVVTSGGMRGTIVALKDDAVHLRVPPDNVKLEVTRSAIVSLTADEDKK